MFIIAIIVWLKKINDEIVKALETEVVVFFNPLWRVVQIEDELYA